MLITAFLGLQGKSDPTINVTPRPREISLEKGSFNIKGAGFNYAGSFEGRTVDAISELADDISAATGKTCSVAGAAGVDRNTDAAILKGVFFVMDGSMEPENYKIVITKKGMKISAPDHNGFYYAVQTLRQMLPVGNYKAEASAGSWSLPCGTVSDGPRFPYRGMHMDPCRHFWSVEETKRYIDVMAMYKLNRLHWHLTDDQGWRVEIKRHPELTEVGAFRKGTMIGRNFQSSDGRRYGGYYTQDQIRDIVDYAWKRGITIIPEVDLPGHMVAALATYPWLGCTGGPYEVWTIWGVSKDVLCVGKESTFTFLEEVMDEICGLFPSKYIHIGGDECPKDRWEKCPDCQALIKEMGFVTDGKGTKEQKLQNYVTFRMQDYLAGKGRKIIGWDEILEGELSPGATVMSWRGAKGGIAAANRGFDVIMTPNDYMYFDYYQAKDGEGEPLGIGGFVPLDKVYGFDPCEGISPDMQKHILGVQANLWTEYIATPSHLEYMLLPRMLALAEVQWCSEGNRDYGRFTADLKAHQEKILDLLGYNYRK